MTKPRDLIVLGGGPAGASAAIEAAALGLDTVLIDEGRDVGGQVYRPPSAALASVPSSPDKALGDDLRSRLRASKVDCRFDRRAWMLERGFRVSCLGEAGPEDIEAEALIVATGAQERHIPLPGWTLPGVIGLAAATLLLKAEKMLPGRRVVVAGTGPLLYLVAADIVEGGGEVAAVVDLNGRSDWLGAFPAMLSRPDLLWRGIGWTAKLQLRGVPIHYRHAVRRIEGKDGVEAVVCGPVDNDGRPRSGAEIRLDADALCLGFGLMPTTETTRLLGARHRYDEARGGWSVETDGNQATSIPKLYACGDGAGVLGAAAAPLGGRIAALAVARDLGRIDVSEFDRRAGSVKADFAKAARFGGAMTALAKPGEGAAELMTPDTLLCRCEGLSRAEIDRAIAAGSRSLVDLKAATRCGMGPCGGRICSEAASMLIATQGKMARSDIPPATARPPLRPVPLGIIAGDFDYSDLPHLPPGPL